MLLQGCDEAGSDRGGAGTVKGERARGCGRFAPSTTGRAHPGTLLAALLCWLDARSQGREVRLRLEDLDRERTKPGYVDGLRADLDWLGLDWDAVDLQSEATPRHEEAIDSLADAGLVYACDCSRADVRAAGRRAPDGSYVYPGTCRAQRVTRAAWRDERRPLRLALPASHVDLHDESGVDLSGDAAALFGDPILRRRDMDAEKKRIWIEDQYRHPEEHILPLPKVVRTLDALGFHWVRTVPPASPDVSLFTERPRPGTVRMAGLRLGWLLRGVHDPDAGLVCYVARRSGSAT